MAKITILHNDGYQYLPNEVEGGTVTVRSGTNMTYTSDSGYTVELVGSGFTYDSAGYASGGSVAGISIFASSSLVVQMVQVSADLQQLAMLGLGYTDDKNGFNGPDGSRFYEYILRGDDTIIGSNDGDDLLANGSGGFGDDLVIAGNGGSYIKADYGSDTLRGGTGYDNLSFEQARKDPLAFRGAIVDAAAGTATDCWGFVDKISGLDAYSDSIFNDNFKGSSISENFRLSRGADTVDGGGGFDTVSYENAGRTGAVAGISVDLAAGTILDPFGLTDKVTSIESIRGTRFADVFKGDAKENSFQGMQGKDSFDGRSGFDDVQFWKNGDLGGTGVTIDLTAATGQIVNDGFGNKENAISIESFYLSTLNDKFTGSSGADRAFGDDGNDTMFGGGGEDGLSGGAGDDALYGGGGLNHLDGNDGRDSLFGGASQDDFNFHELGAANADTIFGFSSTQADEIWLDSAWGGLSAEFLTAGQFRSGSAVTSAATSAQRVIYDTSNGTLYYDEDGVGGAASVKFAVVATAPALTFGDFHVFV